MDRRRSLLGTGLLTGRKTAAPALLLLFLLFLPGAAFGGDGPPALQVQTFPEHAVAGTPWFLTILIDHPLPEDIEIRPPPFPDILALDTVRRDLRFIRGSADRGERWTAVEYRFIPTGGGTARIGPFEIRGPWGSLTTSPVTVEIRAEEIRRPEESPVFSWRAPSELRAGETAFLDLLVLREEGPLPDPALFVPEVPAGAILEREFSDLPPGSFLRLRITALTPPLFSLPSRRVPHGGAYVEIPPLSIPVTEGRRPAGADAERPPVPAEEAAPHPPALFPGPDRRIFPPLRGGYEAVMKRAAGFLAAGDPVRALAELRRNERDALAGPLFAAPRRELERTMGLEDGGNERWRPRALLGALLAGCLATALLLTLLRVKKGVTFLSSWGYRSVMLILLAGAAIGLAGSGGIRLRGIAPFGERSAVMRESAARRVPDSLALESFRFAGGRPVRVRTVRGSWAWVEAGGDAEGGAGWVSLDDIVFY
jgi:hypothetical protein